MVYPLITFVDGSNMRICSFSFIILKIFAHYIFLSFKNWLFWHFIKKWIWEKLDKLMWKIAIAALPCFATWILCSLPLTFIPPVPPSLFLFHLSSFMCAHSGFPTHRVIFVDHVYTLTDGPSCWNVILLLGYLETSCQLLIQADWW